MPRDREYICPLCQYTLSDFSTDAAAGTENDNALSFQNPILR